MTNTEEYIVVATTLQKKEEWIRCVAWYCVEEKKKCERADAETMTTLRDKYDATPWAWAPLAFPLVAWDPVLVVAAAVVGRLISGR